MVNIFLIFGNFSFGRLIRLRRLKRGLKNSPEGYIYSTIGTNRQNLG